MLVIKENDYLIKLVKPCFAAGSLNEKDGCMDTEKCSFAHLECLNLSPYLLSFKNNT